MSDEPTLTPEEETEMVGRINASPYLQPNPPPDEIERVALTDAFLAMSGRKKWETLVLNGLIGTNEPWIGAFRDTLRDEEAELTRLREQIAAKDAEIARLKEKRRMKIVPAPPIVFEDDTP